MEPFDIRSTPARLGPGHLAGVAFLFLVTAYLVVQSVLAAVTVLDRDNWTTGRLVLFVVLVPLAWLCVWLSIPQALVLRRYFGEDRGRQVLTFRLDQEGWRWLQVGTDVLLPWDRLRLRVVDRSPGMFTVRLECAEPVLVGTDPLSRTAHRNLKHRRHTDVPFTDVEPNEDELAAAIEAQSGGRVVLER